MNKKSDFNKKIEITVLVCAIIEAILAFVVHRKIVFIKDDLWYETNLVTGEPLAGLSDILESQIWHYMNWGGRSISHSLLQLILMQGELFADVLNMIVTFTLCYLICELAGKKSLTHYGITFILLFSLNANVNLSMLWQSGSVNYLYATNWILLFLLMYIRHVKNPEARNVKGIAFWIIPLGLITGWSNENMGPACFATAMIVIFYFLKCLKAKPPVWMWLGAVTSLCGSVLLIAAPGNFARNAFMSKNAFLTSLYERFVMMLTGVADYLFPSVFFLLFFMLLYVKSGNKLQPFHLILLITLLLAYGAMILSPTFPSRATFGLMVLCIVLIISFIQNVEKYLYSFALCMWIFGMYALILELRAPLI